MTVESYGHSYEGRDLWLATITDTSTGAHDTKPAHWVDANIHAIEVTGGVAALHLIHHLVAGFGNDPMVTEAVNTRTFYVVPRVNPDGVEWVLADNPKFRRSSVRPWPWRDAHLAPGLHERDINGDGSIRTMRIADPNGGWMAAADDPRLMVRVPAEGAPRACSATACWPRATWSTTTGSPSPRPPRREPGHEPQLPGRLGHRRVRQRRPPAERAGDRCARAGDRGPPQHLRLQRLPHRRRRAAAAQQHAPDSALPPVDVWVWKQLGERGAALTGYTAHSVFEDFTFDKSDTMSGAADDWAYDHLGVYGWTTEFWDVIQPATGKSRATTSGTSAPPRRRSGPSTAGPWRTTRDATPTGCRSTTRSWARWRSADGTTSSSGTTLPAACCWKRWPARRVRGLPGDVLAAAGGAAHRGDALGGDTHRVEVGIANTGWLPTYITEQAKKDHLVLPLVAELTGATVVGAPARQELGQLGGRLDMRFHYGKNDGTPDRVLATWVVQAPRAPR